MGFQVEVTRAGWEKTGETDDEDRGYGRALSHAT
jgi:hypothetical protein